MNPILTEVVRFPSMGWCCKGNLYLSDMRIIRIQGSTWTIHMALARHLESVKSCTLPEGIVDMPREAIMGYLLMEAEWL